MMKFPEYGKFLNCGPISNIWPDFFRSKNKVGPQNGNNFQSAVHFIFHCKLKNDALLLSAYFTFKSGLTRKQKKIFALVKLMKKLNDRRSFFTAKIPVPEFETKPTPRPKNKDRGQI